MKSKLKNNDVYWMTRALRLASLGLARSSPNPSVGACIVAGDQCLGEGVHVRCGSDHAEVIAIKQAQAQGHDLNGTTIYVTLEPCTKHGRTPPCIHAIIAAGIKRVVVALRDPHQDDAASVCQQHQISYECGLLADVAQHLHGGFLKRMHSALPRITGKWAMTLDGCIASASGDSKWISSPEALALSRRRRRVFDTIVIGAGTFRADDPQLLSTADRTPKRVVIAGQSMPDFSKRRIMTELDRAAVYCFHKGADLGDQKASTPDGLHYIAYEHLEDVFKHLAEGGCNEVLVEGGQQLHQACLAAQLYDRLEIYMGTKTLAGGKSVAGTQGAARIELGTAWQLEQDPLRLGDSVCLRYQLSGEPST